MRNALLPTTPRIYQGLEARAVFNTVPEASLSFLYDKPFPKPCCT